MSRRAPQPAAAQDPFGTAGIRERVLRAWAAAPERLREDANSEEDLALGGYRDRVLVELAQNAADAAARAGPEPGRLLLRLVEGPEPALVAANTGAPLQADGVLALSTLRASSKRDGGTTGRFGVGFSAVLAVSDEPSVLAHGAGVRFSRSQTLGEVLAVAGREPALGVELRRRDSHVPALRLPFPAEGSAPRGYDTAVLLPLRDQSAADLVRRLLEQVDDALLLALPALGEVRIELPGADPRVLADVAQRWDTLRRTGFHSAQALIDRPTEERSRPGWSLTWAVPRPGSGAHVPPRLHAPTPTDEPLSWPALLVADLPLDPSRRHVVQGPATAGVVVAAAGAYVELLEELAARGRSVLGLVPTGLAAGWFDAALREEVLAGLAQARILHPVLPDPVRPDPVRRDPVRPEETASRPLRPREAVVLSGAGADDPAVLAVLAERVVGLVAGTRSDDSALRLLQVRRTTLGDVVDQWPDLGGPSAWVHCYRTLAPLAADPLAREALAALPVPLADGRLVRGVRGLLLPTGAVPAEVLTVLAEHGLRTVHPEVAADEGARELLERLGAVVARPGHVLDHPAVLAAVRWTSDDPEPMDVSAAVLDLVRAAWQDSAWPAGGRSWLGDLALPDDEGELTPAGLLVLPGSAMAGLFDPGSVACLDRRTASRWPAEVLQAVGVTGTPVLVRVSDLDPEDPPEELAELDGASEWARGLGDGHDEPVQVVGEVLAVRDLDLVRREGWGELLGLVTADRDLHAALVQEVEVRTRAGGSRLASYTSWWMRRNAGAAGCRAPQPRPDGQPQPAGALELLLPPAPAWAAGLDPAVARAVGLVTDLAELDGAGWSAALQRLAGARVDLGLLLRVWAALVEAVVDVQRDGTPGEHLWALDADAAPVWCPRLDAVVLDDARWWQRPDLGPRLVAPAGGAQTLAEALDLDLASERADALVTSRGERAPVPEAVLARWEDAPATWFEHEELRVDGVEVHWWVQGEGRQAVVHAATADGLGRALAHACGAWGQRHLVAALVAGGPDADAALVDEALS